MNLRGVQGPGRVTVYLQAGNLGAPQVLWNSAEAYPQPLWVETVTHTHASWVFGKPGTYLLAVDVSADLADGSSVTGSAVLRFAVGDAADPDAALAARFTGPLASASAAPRKAADVADSDSGSPAWLSLALVAGAVLLIGALVGVALRGAAVRRRAEQRHARPPTGAASGPTGPDPEGGKS